jgi:SAM-dependent methyltransferase
MEANIANNDRFFTGQGITPFGIGRAVDLGAGCGFQAIPLASAGFEVVAVDFSRQMLDTLAEHAGSLPIRIICADILSFPAWTGRNPELITCMGDTLTHLPDGAAVRTLIRRCATELSPGGKLILSCRDYSREPEGAVDIIPIRRDPDRTFLCRLEYGRETVRVTDILYIRESGTWVRAAGSYPKLRLPADLLAGQLADEGCMVTSSKGIPGMMTLIAEKPARS